MTYTQKQLEAMSRYDIDCAVAILTGYRERWVNQHSDLIPAYCSSYDDMMPLVHKAKIWASYPSHLHDRVAASKFHNGEMIRVEHANPLRAFAIAWILVNQ